MMLPFNIIFLIFIFVIIIIVGLILLFSRRLPVSLSNKIYTDLYIEIVNYRKAFENYRVPESIGYDGSIRFLDHYTQKLLHKYYDELLAHKELFLDIKSKIKERLAKIIEKDSNKEKLIDECIDRSFGLLTNYPDSNFLTEFTADLNNKIKKPAISIIKIEEIIELEIVKINKLKTKREEIRKSFDKLTSAISKNNINDANWKIDMEKTRIFLDVTLILFTIYAGFIASQSLLENKKLIDSQIEYNEKQLESLAPYYPQIQISFADEFFMMHDAYNLTNILPDRNLPYPSPIALIVSNRGKTETPLNLRIEGNVLQGYEEDLVSNKIGGETTISRTFFIQYVGCIYGEKKDCSYEKIPTGIQKSTLKIDCRYCESKERELELPIYFCIRSRDENCLSFQTQKYVTIK